MAAVASAQAQSPPPSNAPYAHLSGYEYDQQWVEALKPHLSADELRTMRSVKVRFSPDPLPPGHPCRNPGRFGFVPEDEWPATIVLCFRNVLYFALFSAETSYSLLLPTREDWDDLLINYAFLYGEANRRHLGEPLTADFSKWVPCHFIEYVMLRTSGDDAASCANGPLPAGRLEKWIADNPGVLQLDKIDAAAREFGLDRATMIRTLPEGVGKEVAAHIIVFTILHEAGHVHLGHLKTTPKGCKAVRQERAADAFAERLLTASTPTPASPLGIPLEDALREARYGWLLYQISMRQPSRSARPDVDRDGLLEARMIATLRSFLHRFRPRRPAGGAVKQMSAEDRQLHRDVQDYIARARLCSGEA